MTTNFTIAGVPLAAGVAEIRKPETYAGFYDFMLVGPNGEPPGEGSDAAKIEMELHLLLEKLLETMKELVRGLAAIEQGSKDGELQIDITPILRLAEALPVFPYWPQIKGMEQKDFDKLIADEKPLLDDAVLTLRRISLVHPA